MNDRGRVEQVVDAAPEMHLAVRSESGGGLFSGAMVVDDSPLWLAWDAAQQAWLESKRRKSGGENTVRAYELACRQFFTFAGVAPWQVSSAHAQRWVQAMASAARTPATINLKLAALSSFYDFVQRRYSIHRDEREISLWPADRANPFGAVERGKVSAYGKAHFPTTDELRSMLAEINTATVSGKRDFALLYTIAQTCRRSSEVTNLKWGDIEALESGDYSFRYRYKGGSERRAVLNRLAYAAIVAYLVADGRPPERMTAEDYIFVPLDPERALRVNPLASTEPNRPISNHTANGILRKYAKRCGVDPLKAHIHGLRHAGARLRVENAKKAAGKPDYMELMELLGHSSLAVTQIYSQTILEDPEDPGGEAAAAALLPRGRRRRQRKPAGEQAVLL